MIERARLIGLCVLILLALAYYGQGVSAGSHTHTLIARSIDENNLVTLAGNTRPEANAKNDRGRADDDFRMEHMWLQLQRSPEQEQALDKLIDQLHDPKSPNYQHWLTAKELAGDTVWRSTISRRSPVGCDRTASAST